MLFAPEMSAMLDRNRERGAAQVTAEDESPFVEIVRGAARDNQLWIHLGSLPVRTDDAQGWRNRSLVIDDQGNIRARYDKLHLFDVDLPTGERWRESSAYAGGDTAVIVDTPVGALGLTICYDVRFAALFDALGAGGADLIAVPAAFTVPTGEAHWHILLRARAIEQGCFIIAAAQSGTHADGRATYGHSLVVSPWGDILLDMEDGPGLAFVDIDLDQVGEARSRIAAIRHRRDIPKIIRC
jgi:predicted amidohydrolase